MPRLDPLALLRGGALAALLVVVGAAPAPAGVVVERVDSASPAGRAGLQAGDLIDAWSTAAANAPGGHAEGRVDSVFDWIWLQAELAPRGAVTIAVEHARERLSIVLSGVPWGVTAGPALAAASLEAYRTGLQASSEGHADGAAAAWKDLQSAAVRANDLPLQLHLHSRLADAFLAANDTDPARAELLAAREVASRAGAPVVEARVLGRLADLDASAGKLDEARATLATATGLLEGKPGCELTLANLLTSAGTLDARSGDTAAARPLYERALAVREAVIPDSVPVADSLGAVAAVADTLGDAASERSCTARAVAILEKLAPEGGELARVLHNHGNACAGRGEVEEAESAFRRELAIRVKLAPGSAAHAGALANLGTVVGMRGRLLEAEKLEEEALAISQKIAPGSVAEANALNNLANTVSDRGDIARAETLLRSALAIYEKQSPDSPRVAMALNNLAGVVGDRRDFGSASVYLERALALREKLGAGPEDLASTLSNLAIVAGEAGDFKRAEELHARALALAEKAEPGGLLSAQALLNLGSTRKKAGDLPGAAAAFTKAQAIFAAKAPCGVSWADVTSMLGETALLQGDFKTAIASSDQALPILTALVPGSIKEADTFHQLGVACRHEGLQDKALDALRRSVAALEVQTGRLGGGAEVGADYRATYRGYYQDLVDLLLEQGKPEAAYSTLETSRARVLLAMLAERDLSFAADLPAGLENRVKAVARETADTLAALSGLNPSSDAEQIRAQKAHLEELHERRRAVQAEIRKASPRLAALQDPKPLDAAGARAALDEGTLVLAYSVGEKRSWLLTLSRERGLHATALPVGEEQLARAVRTLRGQIKAIVTSPEPDLDELEKTSRELGERLLAPAAPEIAKAKRLLILPDGPLHVLPFSALRLDCLPAGRVGYLVECRPVTTALSMTLFAELRKDRPPQSQAQPWSVVAFGDPVYPSLPAGGAESVASPELRAALQRGATLEPLPATRTEVNDIAGVFGTKTGVFLGEQATEESAKRVPAATRVLHFACHGLLDEDFPLTSALALSLRLEPGAGQDNGLFQAWEIFEGMRLHADLVTLSACETALGREVGGEGLIGLSRAFQYAGARTVLASLWSVADESTAALMQHFYENLKRALPKDEALRQAQLALLHTGRGDHPGAGAAADFSNPFFWAAFEFNGDWQ
jgi:CHAT domain-containing protein/Tfp pilus assembly protein PilF